MKKLLFVAAIAMCVMSCGKKAENTECQQEAPAQEQVAAPAEEEAVVEESAAENAVEEVSEAVEAVQEAVAQ